MKIVKILSMFTLIATSTFFLSACSIDKKLSTPEPGSLTVDIQPASEVHIIQAYANQVGREVVVDGKVGRKQIGGRGIVKGHVDIDVVDNDGKTIIKAVASCSPEIISNLADVSSSFATRIPIIAPQGSVVMVKFHNSHHYNEKVL